MAARVSRHSERGVTLLELMIAMTLVAGLSTGMLMAMRTSLLTYEKTAKKLESNRRFVKTQQILFKSPP
jgi:prepilin-type N-terminal cleavage/methylation domain-containing protein